MAAFVSFGRNFYCELSGSRRRGASRARIWISLKRVAAKSIGFYVGKRRVVAGFLRKVVRMARRGRSKNVSRSYDVDSYSHNFDDGRWQKEDEEFYRSRSFSSRFVGLPMQMQSSGL